jgi:steroid 5-alpha reductase family enzyme
MTNRKGKDDMRDGSEMEANPGNRVTTEKQEKKNKRRPVIGKIPSAILILTIYIAGIAAAVFAGSLLPVTNPLWKACLMDVAATLLIFALSVLFDNSSMYDPYWSVAPMALAGYWIFLAASGGADPTRILLIALPMAVWGCRLTGNFVRNWKGFRQEDWRYEGYRLTMGRWYWAVSLTGIHLFPTLIVFAACVPVYFALASAGAPVGAMDFIAFAVASGAIIVEAVTDDQLYRHFRKNPDRTVTMKSGLRRYSRHPNYFGEVLFWWGMYLFVLAADPSYWWTVFGPAVVTALFLFISIPMIEKRMLAGRPDFEEYRKGVSALVPWLPGKRD